MPANDNALIRDLLRRAQKFSAEVKAIRRALVEGEHSGEPQVFDFTEFTRRKCAQHRG